MTNGVVEDFRRRGKRLIFKLDFENAYIRLVIQSMEQNCFRYRRTIWTKERFRDSC